MSYSTPPKYLPNHVYMFTGTIANIPAGMQLCDGTNGTVDLRNRFVVCADADSGGAAKSTITGAALKSHDTGLIPAHTHDSANVFSLVGANNANANSGSGAGYNNVTSTSYGTGTKVIPVFYALAFIQRIGG